MTMFRRLAAVTTFAGLATAIGFSLMWALAAHGPARLEAATQIPALIAALTGIATEPFAAEQQRRRRARAALMSELRANRAVLDEIRSSLGGANAVTMPVYLRLATSAAECAIASGTLAGDHGLLARLHDWRNAAVDFNRRLDLTEMLTFLPNAAETVPGIDPALGGDGGRVHRTSQLLDDVLVFFE